MKAVRRLCRDYQDYLRDRFGLLYVGHLDNEKFRFRKARIVDSNRAPRTQHERFLCEAARRELLKWGILFDEVLEAIVEAERNGANVERAIGEAFLRYWRLVPAFVGWICSLRTALW